MKKNRYYYQSSSFKMAMLFTLLLGASALFLGYSLYDLGKQNFSHETETAIDSEIEHILAVSGHNKINDMANYVKKRTTIKQNLIYYVQSPQEQRLAGNIDTLPKQVKRIKEGIISFTMTQNTIKTIIAAKVHTLHDGSQLLVGRDITNSIALYHRFQFFSFAIMGLLFTVILISFFISTFVVTRINNIANTAKKIMHTGDLSKRINIDSKWDDLSYLAKTLNDLLAKIESLMQGVRDVSDNIAHDLRTPLTRLRGDLEHLKHKPTTEQNIDKLIENADQLLSIFNSLLRIANIEKGKRHQAFDAVDLEPLLKDVAELYSPVAQKKHITLEAHIPPLGSITGDKDLLFQMLANLLDNAIKFSNNGGHISLTAQKNDTTTITIEDNGIGVAPGELDRLFERFYRAEKSRQSQGSGLGLSMVKAIVELHGAHITISHNNPGLNVTITLN